MYIPESCDTDVTMVMIKLYIKLTDELTTHIPEPQEDVHETLETGVATYSIIRE